MMDEVSTATDAKRRCEVTSTQEMARNATEEQKAAEKDKVQTVKKSLEEQQHRNNGRCSNTETTGRLQVAERKAKARQQTRQKAPGKTTAEAENVTRTDRQRTACDRETIEVRSETVGNDH